MEKESIYNFYSINPKYVEELYFLQVEMLKLQKHISDKKMRLAILFEGRDAAGKGSSIFRFSQFLNPRTYRIVALTKPTKLERGQWYFQRYLKRLPNAGQMVFFDRSWYNRAVVEPVMGFCTETQYQTFIEQVNPLEKMLINDGMKIIKFWFSIDSKKQRERIQRRIESPLMRWKVSPVDLAANQKFEDFTYYKKEMFEKTNTQDCPWIIVKGDDREDSRIQAMRYVLSLVDYEGKSEELRTPDTFKLFQWSA